MFLWIALLLTFPSFSIGHSWIACADYSVLTTFNEYNENQCRAFARDFNHYRTDSFGVDRGYNYRLLRTDPVCKTDFKNESSYNGLYRAPEYAQKQKVRLIWPAKNHVKGECTNQWIPDTQLKLYLVPGQYGQNPSLDTVLSKGIVTWDFHSHGTQKGFQQCIDFCKNPDKAVCYGDWVIPDSVVSGSYLLVWFWEFNKDEFYTSCMDIKIRGGFIPPVPSPNTKTTISTQPPTTANPCPKTTPYLQKCQRLLNQFKKKHSC